MAGQRIGWMAFGSTLPVSVGAFTTPRDASALTLQAAQLRLALRTARSCVGSDPFFGGDDFSIVAAVFGLLLRYFDAFEAIADFHRFEGLQKVLARRAALVVPHAGPARP